METTARRLRPKPLGLIWVSCSSSVVEFGLEKTLEAEARIHRGESPPKAGVPSCVVYGPDSEDDVPSGIKRLQELAPGATIVVFGPSPAPTLARAALRAGARGFIHAGMEPSQIVRAVSVASRGETVVPRDVLRDLVAGEQPADLALLTARQREILKLVAEGLTNGQVAKRLFLSESTVKQHLRAVYKALGVRNRTEAARLFRTADR